MFKKVVVLILAMMCLPVFANSKNEFKNILDEFNYDLTVEWDQKDQAFVTQKMAQFEKQLSQLIQNGLTTAEVQEVFAASNLSSETLEKLKLTVMLNKLSTPAEVMNFIKNNRMDIYHEGESWNGDVWFQIGFWTAMAGMLVVMFWIMGGLNWESTTCTERSTVETCSWIEDDCMTYDEGGYCISYHTPYEYCEYACVNWVTE